MLRKEYFDCPQRDSHTVHVPVHYISKRGERGVCTLLLCSLATVMSCIDPSVRIVTKSPKVGPLLIVSVSLNRKKLQNCVADPDPNPDPHVFGPPGSGSTSQRYGSGSGSSPPSGSFYYHAKIVRKTLIPTILWLFLLFISEKWCKCTFKK